MKNKNKFLGFLISIFFIVSMTSSLAANAANTSDTYWLAGNSYCRYKADASSVYVKNSSLIYSVKVSIYGEHSATATAHNLIGPNTENIIISPNTTVYIPQYCNEWGYEYLYIVFEVYGDGYASGVWSADSI